jgi:hypothetical protein
VKINDNYSNIGEVPGITVDEFKRKKILRDLETQQVAEHVVDEVQASPEV